MKWDLAKMVYLLVGVAALVALLGELNVWAPTQTWVPTTVAWLLIIGGLNWGAKALMGKDFFGK